MKPDDFDDNIRRKLDGIEPSFREKDWAQMQQVMRQHGMITPWSAAPSWLMPAVGVVSVAALLTTTVWLGQSNQQLRQDVQRLSQTVTQLKQTPQTQTALPARVDTVYLTRTVPVPTNNQPTAQSIEPNVSVPQPTPTRDNTVATQSQTNPLSGRSDQNQIATRPPGAANAQPDVNQPADRTGQPAVPTSEPDRRSEAPEKAGVGTAPADAAGNRVTRETNRDRTATGANRTNADQPVGSSRRGKSGTPSATAGQPERVASTGNRNPTRTDAVQSGANKENGTPGGPGLDSQTSATAPIAIEELAAKPMRLDPTSFEEGISQAVRRLRRLYPAKALPVSPTVAPEATAVVTPNERFRLGVSSELGLNRWAAGVYGDVRLGRHFLLGVGLERVAISGGKFSSDIVFEQRIRRNFRSFYAGGIDDRHIITSIDRRSVTWQVPITLGYGIPVGAGIVLTPTVGASASLWANENVYFTYVDLNRKGPGPFEVREARLPTVRRPVQWYHSWSASLGVEKRWGPLTVQVSPYLVGPFVEGELGLNGTSHGGRLRMLYSF